MSNTELANIGLFVISTLGFGMGTIAFGATITNCDEDEMFIAAWIVGCIVFGIAMIAAYGV